MCRLGTGYSMNSVLWLGVCWNLVTFAQTLLALLENIIYMYTMPSNNK